MTDATGGTPNPAPASTQDTSGTPASGSLLTDGTPAAANADPAAASAGAAADGAGKSDDKGTPAAPEKYDLKMPEGVELDTVLADEFGVIAKELKLDNVAAQKVADLGAKIIQKQQERAAETVKGWVAESKADKEFGGDNLEQNLAVAEKALSTFGSESLKSLLKDTRMGNHPEVVRFFFKVGKAISEDTFNRSGSRAATPDTPLANKLYPNMT